MKHIGLSVFILGALVLIIPAVADFESKITLILGLALILVGLVLHCIFTKKAIDAQFIDKAVAEKQMAAAEKEEEKKED
ncbi:MAG: hypothetical protein J5808_01795 [Paludibacteraceae bacterium]|nr:hypothetical protein [Paludibacteraceae bacterium]